MSPRASVFSTSSNGIPTPRTGRSRGWPGLTTRIGKLRRETGVVSPFLRPQLGREAVRTLPHSGDGSNPGEGAEGALRAPQRLSRDDAVWRLCQVIRPADGLRNGLHSLACIFQDERGQIRVLPLYLRRQIARRLKEALGDDAFQSDPA